MAAFVAMTTHVAAPLSLRTSPLIAHPAPLTPTKGAMTPDPPVVARAIEGVAGAFVIELVMLRELWSLNGLLAAVAADGVVVTEDAATKACK